MDSAAGGLPKCRPKSPSTSERKPQRASETAPASDLATTYRVREPAATCATVTPREAAACKPGELHDPVMRDPVTSARNEAGVLKRCATNATEIAPS